MTLPYCLVHLLFDVGFDKSGLREFHARKVYGVGRELVKNGRKVDESIV